jgi:hypothetical protein
VNDQPTMRLPPIGRTRAGCRPDANALALIHHAFVEALLRTGKAPKRAEVAAALSISIADLDAALASLEAAHGAVLDSHSGEPWVLHPFSLSPTGTWVEQGDLGWWAPCPWCAFGIAGLVGGDATVHSRLGGDREPIAIHVVGGRVVEDDLCIHFAFPPRDAWNNVHRFCATVLPFRGQSDVTDWCARHGIARGETAPVAQVWALGRDWYARHADPSWRKWTGAEAAAIFDGVGLTGSFWRFERSDQPF